MYKEDISVKELFMLVEEFLEMGDYRKDIEKGKRWSSFRALELLKNF